MRLKILPFLTLLSLSLLIFSCSEQPTGLFFSIEQERLIDDKNLSNDLTAGTLVVYDLDNDGTDNFILAGGKIYHSRASADRALQGDWSSLYHLGADFLSYHVFVLGADLYGLFYRKNPGLADSGSQLYRFDTVEKVWNIVTDGNVDQLRLEDGAQAGNYLYFSSYTLDSGGARTYSLKAFDGTTVTDIPATILSRGRRLDAAINGSDVFLVYGSLLLQGTGPGGTFSPAGEESLVNFTDAKSYRGVYYSNLINRFLLSAGDGTLWFYDTDLEWKSFDDGIGREAFDFSDFDHVDPDVSLVLVGSSRGYYEKETGSSAFTLPEISTSQNNYLTLDFSQGAVRSLFSYSEGGLKDDVLFALTSGNGLWSLREDNGRLVWNQE